MDDNYKPNSDKEKEALPKKRVEPVITGKVTKKKATLAQKFANTFIDDDVNDVGHYVVNEILIPALKDGTRNVLIGMIEALFGRSNGNRSRGPTSYVSYNRYSTDNSGYRQQMSGDGRAYSYDSVYFESHKEAQSVLDAMEDLIATYKMVSVADLYDLAGLKGTPTDYNYGWTAIRNPDIELTSRGWIIRLPKALPLE